jgi:cysteine synthase
MNRSDPLFIDVPLSSVIDSIGNTPVVELARFTKGLDGRILAKLDYLNPGFSKKDRIARQIIEDAESSGELQPGQTVVELTSGNTGTGLAIVCGIKGYHFVAVMSKGNSIERARMMSALGAEVVLVDQLPESQPGQVSGGDLELVENSSVNLEEISTLFAILLAQAATLLDARQPSRNTIPRYCVMSLNRKAQPFSQDSMLLIPSIASREEVIQ